MMAEIPYSMIIPDEFQSELLVIAETGSKLAWRTGDVTALILEYNQVNENPVGIMDVYSAVGAFIGKSSRTVRDYHAVASFYPNDLDGARNKPAYSILSFDHYRQAMVLGPNWQEALDWAVEQVDSLGRPATVDAMIAKYMVVPDMGDGAEAGDGEGAGDEGAGDSPENQIRAAVLTIKRNLPLLEIDNSHLEQIETALQVLEEILVTS